MKRFFLQFAFLLLYSFNSFAQTNATDSTILKPIYQLFDGFRNSDSAMVANAFYDRNPFLGSSFLTKDGESKFVKDRNGLQPMLNAVGVHRPDSLKWDERLTSIEIFVDAGMASVITGYEFYVGEERKHCGFNFFTLVLTENGWKILGVTDTRRKNCIN